MDTGESPKNNEESRADNPTLDPTNGNDSKSDINQETTNPSLPDIQSNDEESKPEESNSNINEETTNSNVLENQGTDQDNVKSTQLEYDDVNSIEEKQDEDVPEDFFDDFLKEDFMAGLDIVDEDDEVQEDRKAGDSQSKSARKKPIRKPEGKFKNRPRNTAGKIDHVKKFRESPPGQKISEKQLKHQEFEEKMQKLDEELEEMKKARPKRKEKPKSGVDADNFDIRRDPEKTRQAIQKDKIKSAKDKEKRIITDIVETGLVPPGMELEIGIEEVRRIEKNLPPGDLRAKIKPRKSSSKSPEKVKSSIKKAKPQAKKRSRSPKQKRKSRTPTHTPPKKSVSSTLTIPDTKLKSPQKSSDRSVSRRSPRRSPVLRRTPPRRSPRRSPLLRRSPVMRRSPPRRSPLYRPVPVCSPPFRIVERSPLHRRRSRSISPRIRRRSPLLYRRSRSRDRSPGYHRKRERSFSPMDRSRRRRSRSPVHKLRKEEKISFLEELAAKLNETHPKQQPLPPIQMTYMMPMQAQPVVAPVPPPVPVPPPQSIFFSAAPAQQPMQQHSQFDHYDQSFFIGNQPQQLHQQEQHQQPPMSQATQPNGFVIEIPDLSPTPTRDVDKLFGDQRIKLSDFLAITAKPQVNNSSPAKLQEKIEVIQRCQHAIKILNEKKFTGPLVVHKTNLNKRSTDMTMSPLLRRPVIQLPFTTPGMKKSNSSDFAKCCDTLLYRLGIDKTPSSHKDFDKPVSKTISPNEVPQRESSPPNFSNAYSEPSAPPKAITKNLSTQTDKELSACKDCLRRKGIIHKTFGVQAGGHTLSFSVSTQVSEGDFYSMIPKTRSLASLTPAQLLGKQSMLPDQSRTGRNSDSMSRPNYIPSPPPPPIFQFLPPQGSSQQAPSPMFHQTIIPSLLKMPSMNKPQYGERDNAKPSFSEKRQGGFNSKRY